MMRKKEMNASRGSVWVVFFLSLLLASSCLAVWTRSASADTYSVTIQAWDSVHGWQSVPITVNGISGTGWTTPHTFTLNEGETATFAVPYTDGWGTQFTGWDTGETTLYIGVSSGGTHTAQYYVPYNVTIWAFDDVAGEMSEPIKMDGLDTGDYTPYTFTVTGTNNFTLPLTDTIGTPFYYWEEPFTKNQTITVSSSGTYTAEYSWLYDVNIQAFDTYWGWLSEPFTVDGVSASNYITPATLDYLKGTHTITVPDTDSMGTKFTQWDTGETSTTLTISSGGTYTAQYYETYNATIWAWENVSGWLAEPIQMDGAPTGYSTPHNFTGLTGTHTFTVPSTDTNGNPFINWTTGETNPTITVSANGTYTAQYYVTSTIPEFPDAVILPLAAAGISLIALKLKKTPRPR